MAMLSEKEEDVLSVVVAVIYIAFLLIGGFIMNDIAKTLLFATYLLLFLLFCLGVKVAYNFATDKEFKKRNSIVEFIWAIIIMIFGGTTVISCIYSQFYNNYFAKIVMTICQFSMFLIPIGAGIIYVLKSKYEKLFTKSLCVFGIFCGLVICFSYIKISQEVISLTNNILFFIPIGLMLLSFIIWYLFGRDKKNFEIVEFNSPENINPITTSYFYHQGLIVPDIVPQLFDFQQRGYIQIDKKLIHKVKDYDGEDENERKFLEILFYKTQNKLKFENLDENKKRIREILFYVKNNLAKEYTSRVSNFLENMLEDFMLLSWFCIFVFLYLHTLIHSDLPFYGNIFTSFLFFIPVIFFTIYERTVNIFVTKRSHIKYATLKDKIILTSILLLIFVILSFIKSIPESFWLVTKQVFAMIIATFMTRVLQLNLVQWNEKGWQIVNKVLGYKKYLQKVEFDKIIKTGVFRLNDFIKMVPYMYIFEYRADFFKNNEDKKRDDVQPDLLKTITPHIQAISFAIEKIKNMEV